MDNLRTEGHRDDKEAYPRWKSMWCDDNISEIKDVIATNKEMKSEAMKRMLYLRLFDDVIVDFVAEDKLYASEPPMGIYSTVSNEDLEHINNFERKYDKLVYFVIRCTKKLGDIDNFLYVSSHKNDWIKERDVLKHNNVYSYSYVRDQPNLSLIGVISIERTEAKGLVRK